MTTGPSAAARGEEPGLTVFSLCCGGAGKQREALREPRDREWIEPLLLQNAIWFCRLRWLVVITLAASGGLALLPAAASELGLGPSARLPLAAALVLAGSNLVFAKLARRAAEGAGSRSVSGLLWAQIVTDLLVLTGVIRWLGSGWEVAPFMYLFHIILACVVFTPGASLGVAGLAASLYVGGLLLESWGLLNGGLGAVPTVQQGSAASLPAGIMSRQVLPMLAIWGVIWYLVSRLASALRTRERALYVSNARLLASIEERSKHMLLTTHQLKAPFAAIHAQTQLLLGGYCGAVSEKVGAVLSTISDRCRALSRQIQEMLQLANLRSQGQTSAPAQDLQFDGLIEEVIARVAPAAQQRDIRLECALQPVRVFAVADHLTMVLENLVGNAVTYSYPGGVVNVSCQPAAEGEVVLVIRDEGIGIPSPKLPHIFDDYYRTEEAVQHNRASTGLGLAIVRQVACQDALTVLVESAPGWGTRFTVTIPMVLGSRTSGGEGARSVGASVPASTHSPLAVPRTRT